MQSSAVRDPTNSAILFHLHVRRERSAPGQCRPLHARLSCAPLICANGLLWHCITPFCEWGRGRGAGRRAGRGTGRGAAAGQAWGHVQVTDLSTVPPGNLATALISSACHTANVAPASVTPSPCVASHLPGTVCCVRANTCAQLHAFANASAPGGAGARDCGAEHSRYAGGR
jgi:hypothetical protein